MSIWDLDQRFQAAFPRGLGLTSNPITGPVPMPISRPAEADPFKLNPAAMDAWRGNNPLPSPVDQPIRSAVPGNEQAAPAALPSPLPPPAAIRPPTPFPSGGTSPVPFGPNPTVQAGGPSGLTLSSTPPATGWGGTVGMESAPAAKPAFDQGNWDKLMSGLEQINKGVQNKQAPSDMNTITPMSSGAGNVGGSGGGQMGANLLAQLLAANRSRYM